jgi:hypothetical protein
MWRTALILFLFGALVGNAYNSFHAFSGTIPVTLIHINPLLDWSSYLLFGFAGLSIGLLTLFFDKIFKRKIPKVTALNVAGALLFLGLFYFSSACMFLSNTIIILILAIGFILSVILYDRSGTALLAAVIVAIVGTSAEMYFVHSGMYYYSRPQILGVAYWLPLLYGIASVTTGQLARALYYSDRSNGLDVV